MAMRVPKRRRSWGVYRVHLPGFFRMLYHIGIKAPGFWRSLLTVPWKNPGAIDGFFFDAMFLYHLHPYGEHIVSEMARYVASPLAGDVLPPAPPSRPSRVALKPQLT